MNPVDNPPICPLTEQPCQAKREQKAGRFAGYFVATIASLYLGAEWWSYDKRGEELPWTIPAGAAVVSMTSLAVGIPPEIVGKLLLQALTKK